MDNNKVWVSIVVLIHVILLGMCAVTFGNNETAKATFAAAPIESSKSLETSMLKSWCGELVGDCRMIGGWFFQENAIQTQDGHIWDMNTESINPHELLLIWFDDMGTSQIEDDQIIRIWSEIYD